MEIENDLLEAIRYIDACTNSFSTDEQIDFASDFTKPMISFSNPGTGKTHSVVRGLILAQTYHKVPGRYINTMSFTDAATAEISHRYEDACNKCGITATVEFNTFHKICKSIILDAYPDMKISGTKISKEDLEQLNKYMVNLGIPAQDMFTVRCVYETIDKLNHAFVYDTKNIEMSYDFKQLNMDVDDFQELRKQLFKDKLYSRFISVGDMPLYALFALCKKKSIKDSYLGKYKIMVVDEFQDMTKLYLVILSMISKNLIVIGDMKQQIYGFNGANPHIAEMYKKAYPEARNINLTQSFRCGTEISEFATKVYQPNDPSIKAFKGAFEGAEVIIKPARELDIKKIVGDIAENREKARNSDEKKKDVMFLFRNNYSITPIAEELYKQRVPFRVKKFKTVMDMPVYHELCMYADIAENPEDIEALKNVPFIFPQFRKYKNNSWENPIYKLAVKEIDEEGLPVSIFDLEVEWDVSSQNILKTLKIVRNMIKKGATCDRIFEVLLPLYDKYVIDGKWWILPNKLDYYTSMIQTIITAKTYPVMKKEEFAKKVYTEDAIRLNQGVKCYTMHSAKGLEADEVYIIDADQGTFPNTKKLDKVIKSGCVIEAAKTIREERNLLYVGITRAKSKVIITYNDSITPLISTPAYHKYSYLDDVYNSSNFDFKDMEYFKGITNIHESTERLDSGNTYINDESAKIEAVPELEVI